ncbi:hypothetical protein BDN70DRAFT_939081 [Pholiota conissans]|uniref:Uncharacterized protein n=1 Tax=Pholiota conissans TaxID=109636 RepID=A0A9P5YLZ1_9AGAR|nr:hypothetical protein BDN70DRAFT_939081 [Pholiota conissans]
MGSGKNEGFPLPMKAWLEKQESAYIAKTAYGKSPTPEQPEPKDDTDLKKHVDNLFTAFKVQFAVELNDGELSDAALSTRFHAWFRNRKAAAKREVQAAKARGNPVPATSGTIGSSSAPSVSGMSTTMPPDMNNLWAAVMKSAKITGRSLFEELHRDGVSAEVSDIRRQKNIGSKAHVGMLNSKLKAMWEDLGDQKEDWNEKAELARNDENLIYRNQAALAPSIYELLSALIGPVTEGNHHIGNAQFHVLYAFRNSEEKLCAGGIDVLGFNAKNQTPFQATYSDYDKYVLKPWKSLSQRDLPPNRCPNTTSFRGDSDGYPILPSISDAITPDSLRNLLVDFIQAQWMFFKSSEHPVPWDDPEFQQHVNPLIGNLPNPATAKPRCLYQLHEDIESNQPDEKTGFRLFIDFESTPKPSHTHEFSSTSSIDSLPDIPVNHVSQSVVDITEVGPEPRVGAPEAVHELESAPPTEAPDEPLGFVAPSLVTCPPMAPASTIDLSKSLAAPTLVQNSTEVPHSASVPPALSVELPTVNPQPVSAVLGQSALVPLATPISEIPSATSRDTTSSAKKRSSSGAETSKPAKKRKRGSQPQEQTRSSGRVAARTHPKASEDVIDVIMDSSSTSSVLNDNPPVFLNRNGKPVRDTKRWIYVAE